MAEINSSKLELHGKIYLVSFDAEGNEVERDELDAQTILEIVGAVLDNAIRNPILDKIIVPTQ